jgi:copper chaperone CopZ
MERVHYTVTGLLNNNCKTQVKNALDEIEGVQMVAVDLGRSSIEVAYGEETTQEEIRECIENTGFKIES